VVRRARRRGSLESCRRFTRLRRWNTFCDILLAINDVAVPRAAVVANRLYRAGLWTQLRYKLSRNGEEFETRLVTTPPHKPITVENYLRVVGLLYLFIGLFIFARRWNAPRAVHFYVFCLVSFVVCSFHFSGKLDTFDLEVYWSGVVAGLFAPALLLHFALVFPERPETSRKSLMKFAGFICLRWRCLRFTFWWR